MKKAYGEEKGEQIFYASKNKGTISGVDSKSKNGPSINDPAIRNQIRVALQTLKMPSAMLGVMGGTTKEQAKEILRKYGVKFEDSKMKDQEIKITIGEDPVNPSPAEQKVEGNDVIYKEYTLKQLPETGEFEIYAPGGSIVGHAKALELAKLFVDRIVASKIEG
jgi:hypothetical protein